MKIKQFLVYTHLTREPQIGRNKNWQNSKGRQTTIIRDFNAPLSIVDRMNRHKKQNGYRKIEHYQSI